MIVSALSNIAVTINTANNTNSTEKRPTLSFTPTTNVSSAVDNITCDLNFDSIVMFQNILATNNTVELVQITTQSDGSYFYTFNCTDGISSVTSDNMNINIGVYTYEAGDLATITIDGVAAIGAVFASLATLIGLGLVWVYTLGLVWAYAKKKF
jgi:hypothetical protein